MTAAAAEVTLLEGVRQRLHNGWVNIKDINLYDQRKGKEDRVQELLHEKIFSNIKYFKTRPQAPDSGPYLLFGELNNDSSDAFDGRGVEWVASKKEWKFSDDGSITKPSHMGAAWNRRPDFIFYNVPNENVPKTNSEDKTSASIDDLTEGLDRFKIKNGEDGGKKPSQETEAKDGGKKQFLVLEIKVCQRNKKSMKEGKGKDGKCYGYHYNNGDALHPDEWDNRGEGDSRGYAQVGCTKYNHLFTRAQHQAEYYAEHLRRKIPNSNVTYAVVVFFWDRKGENKNELVGYRWLAEDGTDDIVGEINIP